ncbi:MAG: hypothetical protein U9P14_12090, partial [Gemmatimonadota bacterium]|nr:hypothetical protein [Gemmatimonadota bacterium]
MKRPGLLNGILILLAAAALHGQSDISVGTDLFYDSNIFRNYAGRSDMVTMPYANLGYQFRPGRQEEALDYLYFGYSGQLYFFNELGHRDFSVHRLGVDF